MTDKPMTDEPTEPVDLLEIIRRLRQELKLGYGYVEEWSELIEAKTKEIERLKSEA